MKETKLTMLGFSAAIMLSLGACTNEAGNNEPDEPQEERNTDALVNSEKLNFHVDTLSSELQNPWGIAFLPDNKILVTERAGEIRVFENGELSNEKIAGVPEVYANGQGGLLDIVVHPDYDNNGWIYLTYAKPGDNGGGTTLARTKLDGNSFSEFEELFSVDPFVDSRVHFGSRIAFDGQGHVFVSTGERGTKDNAQTLENHHGKVLRLNEDGSVPDDNPFVNEANAKPEIWTYGHRNVQGMVYDADSDILWTHEHGPQGGDEINIVEKGNNYGWPKVTHGIDYDGSVISEETEMEGITPAVHFWDPSIAPCGMALVTGDKFSEWKGNLLVGALSFQHVARVTLSGKEYEGEEKLLDGVGRVRAVSESPDGYIYVATEEPGMLLRLSPEND